MFWRTMNAITSQVFFVLGTIMLWTWMAMTDQPLANACLLLPSTFC
jgi:hypothetical protein